MMVIIIMISKMICTESGVYNKHLQTLAIGAVHFLSSVNVNTKKYPPDVKIRSITVTTQLCMYHNKTTDINICESKYLLYLGILLTNKTCGNLFCRHRNSLKTHFAVGIITILSSGYFRPHKSTN